MGEPKSGNAWRLSAAVAMAALLVWAFYPRAAHPPAGGAPASLRAPASPMAASPPAAPGVAGGNTARTTMPANADEEDSMPPADASRAAGTVADERQLVKIARGLSAGSDGALHVTATPPGSVVGQLHLQPGDVIVTVNGQPVASPEEFARIYHEEGLPTELTLIRRGREVHRH